MENKNRLKRGTTETVTAVRWLIREVLKTLALVYNCIHKIHMYIIMSFRLSSNSVMEFRRTTLTDRKGT